MDSKGIIHYLLPYIKKYWAAYFLVFLLLASGVGLDLVFAMFLKTTTDAAVNGDLQKVQLMLLSGIVLMICGFIINYFTKVINAKNVDRIKKEIKIDLFNHFLRLPLSYVDRNRSGDIIARLNNDVNGMSGILGNDIFNLFRHPLAAAVTFVYLSTINWVLAILCLFLGPLAVVTGYFFGKVIRKNSKKQQEAVADIQSTINDSIFGFSLLRSFQLEQHFSKKYTATIDNAYHYEVKGAKWSAAFNATSSTIGSATSMISLGLGALFVVKGSMTVGELIAFVSLLSNLTTPFTGLSAVWTNIQKAMAAGERALEIKSEQVHPVFIQGRRVIENFTSMISFQDINFSYNDVETLKGINLEINIGETVAIVGPSGSGKSTLVKLLLGMYSPHNGKIMIDNEVVHHFQSDFRPLFSYVPQESLLFSDSAKNNIKYGNLISSDDEILTAAKLSYSDQFIQLLEDGYDTKLGERGTSLSGGQRQKIALARAFLKDVPILILDEATSSLDYVSELQIRQSVQELMVGKTTIIIAHRVETIKNADKIVVMNEGTIVDQGTHEHLISNNLFYQQFYETMVTGQT
ncbi:ABC transporter ATP-binding protein [Paenibacillus yanchengensis]|uniref:ABC transporter ATP-binding protein n=1 Tax=Paenibacillus yanchengensis TaxID=2035833 RepID=A0ABW4YLZ3_9BACL